MSRSTTTRSGRCFLVATDDTTTYPFEGFSVEVVFTQPNNGDTVSIGSRTYTFQTVLTNVDGNVNIGGTAAATSANFLNALNATGGGTPGTDYALATTPHPDAGADVSLLNDAVHVVSLDNLALANATDSRVQFRNWDGVNVTAMIQYASGDWTMLPAYSAAIDLTGCRVTGVTLWGGAVTGTQTSLFVYNHAGTAQVQVALRYSAASSDETHQLELPSGFGLAASITNSVVAASYVHWEGFRDYRN